MKLQMLAVLALCVGCSSKKSEDPILNVGSFGVPVPEAFHNVTSAKMEPGSVAIQTLKVGEWKEKSPVTIMIHPLPEPLTKDPTDEAACKEHAASLPLTVKKAEVITLPVGKACAVEASRGETNASQIVVAVKGHGLMANCSYKGDEKKMCDQIFQRITLR